MMIYYIITMFIESIWQTLHSDQKWDLKKGQGSFGSGPFDQFSGSFGQALSSNLPCFFSSGYLTPNA